MGKIVLKKMISPAFNRIVTTADKYKSDKVNGLYSASANTSRYMDVQRVVAVGPTAHGVDVGDIVNLSFERYKVREFKNSLKQDDPSLQHMDRSDQYDIPAIEIDGKEYFLIGDNDIMFTIPEGGYEEIVDDEESSIIHPDSELIL